MSKRVNIESLKEFFPAAGHFLVVLRVAQLAQKYDSQTVQHIHSNGQERDDGIEAFRRVGTFCL